MSSGGAQYDTDEVTIVLNGQEKCIGPCSNGRITHREHLGVRERNEEGILQ